MHPDQHGSALPPALVVVGELNADLILEDVNALPELDKERIARGMTLTLGSSSAILASNAAALGLPVGFVGCVGVDLFGSYVKERLSVRGVDVRHVMDVPEQATGLTVVYTHGDRRGALTYPGAMDALTIEDLPWSYIRQARHLHLSSYYLQRGLRPDCAALFRRAKEAGLSTSFDTNWDPDDAWGSDVLEVLPYVDVFFPNDQEARLISGAEDLDEALARLAQRAGTVVATCGAEGVQARQGDVTYALPAFSADPVDAVGAGDSFNAGFLYRYLQGSSLEACLQAGLLTGAFSVLAPGGTTAFDNMERFARFAEANEVSFPLEINWNQAAAS